MHICCAAHGGLVDHRPVTPHTPGCYVGAGCSGARARAVQVRYLSLEVLCERCAVHGAARCGGGTLRLARGRAEGPCEGHKGLADGTGERVRFCVALLLDAVGTRCAARAALLWCEPRFPDACAAGAEAIGAAREPGARALQGRAGAGAAAVDAKVQRRTFDAQRDGRIFR